MTDLLSGKKHLHGKDVSYHAESFYERSALALYTVHNCLCQERTDYHLICMILDSLNKKSAFIHGKRQV